MTRYRWLPASILALFVVAGVCWAKKSPPAPAAPVLPYYYQLPEVLFPPQYDEVFEVPSVGSLPGPLGHPRCEDASVNSAAEDCETSCCHECNATSVSESSIQVLVDTCLKMWALLWDLGSYPEAQTLAEEACRLDPNNVAAQHALVISQIVGTTRLTPYTCCAPSECSVGRCLVGALLEHGCPVACQPAECGYGLSCSTPCASAAATCCQPPKPVSTAFSTAGSCACPTTGCCSAPCAVGTCGAAAACQPSKPTANTCFVSGLTPAGTFTPDLDVPIGCCTLPTPCCSTPCAAGTCSTAANSCCNSSKVTSSPCSGTGCCACPTSCGSAVCGSCCTKPSCSAAKGCCACGESCACAKDSCACGANCACAKGSCACGPKCVCAKGSCACGSKCACKTRASKAVVKPVRPLAWGQCVSLPQCGSCECVQHDFLRLLHPQGVMCVHPPMAPMFVPMGQAMVELPQPVFPCPGMMMPPMPRPVEGYHMTSAQPMSELPGIPCARSPHLPLGVHPAMRGMEEMPPHPVLARTMPTEMPLKVTAHGKRVHLVSPCLEAHCDRMVYLDCADRVLLEGKVRVTLHSGSQSGKIAAERVVIGVHDGSVEVNPGTGQDLPPLVKHAVPGRRPLQAIQPASYTDPVDVSPDNLCR